jgi:hypothetical protein
MKWFKHETSAHVDAKLIKLRMRYGLEGYGLYWYCLEMIANSVEPHNLTFELEHDSEVISYHTGLHHEKVELIMRYMVEVGLFENDRGVVTCLKLAKRMDSSMTSNAKMRGMIKRIRDKYSFSDINSHDTVMIESCDSHDTIMQERKKERKKEVSENKFSDDDLKLSKFIYSKIKLLDPKVKKPNFNKWADTIRLLREVDNRSQQEIQDTFIWANESEFWRSNILSPSSLRKNFTKLDIQRKSAIKKSIDQNNNESRSWI